MKHAFRSFLVGCAVAFAAAPGAEAAARVFVSVNGNDANTCSNIATPCRTLNAGITQVDAAGEVIVIDTGSFAGANVTKSVKINVPTGVVAFSASPITVAAGASDVVVIRGLTVKAVTPGVGVGVDFTGGGSLYVENCVIDGWQIGIHVSSAGRIYVTDTTVRNSAVEGLLASVGSGTASVTVDLSRFEGNDCGIFSGTNAKATVRDSVASGNAEGFCAVGGQLSIHNSVAANNSQDGVLAEGGSTIRIGSSIVTNNVVAGLNNSASTIESLGNNLVQGNGTDTIGTITVVAGK
jgi:hypothetical protein